MKRKPKFEVYAAADGYRWRLKASHGRIVATGQAHPRKADAVRAAAALSGLADVASKQPPEVIA